jgi:hypothetical protein
MTESYFNKFYNQMVEEDDLLAQTTGGKDGNETLSDLPEIVHIQQPLASL